MKRLNDVIKDGFILQESNNNDELDIAFTSLKIALMSYFTTYQDCHSYIGVLVKTDNDVSEEDISYHNSYYNHVLKLLFTFSISLSLHVKRF